MQGIRQTARLYTALTPEMESKFAALVAERTGLIVPLRDRAKLRGVVISRLKCLRITDPGEYYFRLLGTGPEASLEWEEFTGPLTTGESYFFRDRGQFSLLENQILPEIIRNNQSSRSVRIWSAGCSTGEEPYSLAMLLMELLPSADDWDLFILGTDLNRAALEKARRGMYSAWSFRGVNPKLRIRHFHPFGEEWHLDQTIRSRVRFQTGNLIKDEFPSVPNGLHNFDLIICRNVFIYFDQSAVGSVLKKFTASLRAGGYLLTGHTEVLGLNSDGLAVRSFPESLVYQRQSQVPHHSIALPSTNRSPKATAIHPVTKAQLSARARVRTPLETNSEKPMPDSAEFNRAKSLLNSANYDQAIVVAESIWKQEPRNIDAMTLLAEAHANRGEYETATRWSRAALDVNPLALAPYCLLARIAEQQGDRTTAKEFFKKVIYLDPNFAVAYIELGELYERESDASRARKMRLSALEALKKKSADSPLDAFESRTNGDVTAWLEERLAETPTL